MKKALYVAFALLLIYLVGNGTVSTTGGHPPIPPSHLSDNPWATPPADDASDCDVEGATDQRSLELGRRMCGAMASAEAQAACLGDWQPPDPVNARQFCLEVQRRGCGDPGRDCMQIPADQTYYTRHRG